MIGRPHAKARQAADHVVIRRSDDYQSRKTFGVRS